MRTVVLLVGLCAVAVSARLTDRSTESSEDIRNAQVKPFQSGYEFKYKFDAQVSSGFSPQISEQNAISRIQADVRLHFTSEEEAVLRMNNIRFGQINDEISEPKSMLSMRKFEEKELPKDTKNQLRMPIRFVIRDGMVEDVQFQSEDQAWSKNVKRAVLNLLQLNLQGKTTEELRDDDSESSTEQKNSRRSYTISETTLEGLCPTTYTIYESQKGKSNGEPSLNVTKSIDFKQCEKVADVAYGFQTANIQPECIAEWNQEKQQQQQPSPLCDPKVVKDNKIDRSTVLRHKVHGTAKNYGIEHAEVLSQYIVKSLKMESREANMHVVSIAQLVYEDAKQVQMDEKDEEKYSQKTESLMYSSEWDVAEKRFYMLGDEGYGRESPFKQVEKKAERVAEILREISNGMESHEKEELAMAVEAGRLVEYVRMCTKDELKEIVERIARPQASRDSKQSEHEEKKIQQRMQDLFYDTLAVAGTHNTIKFLAEKISNSEIPKAKAVTALKALHGLPAPSKQQVDTILELCQSWTVKESAPLKQACWLTLGSMVSELCEKKNGISADDNDNELCPQRAKESYSQVLVQECKSSEHMYEKVLAMKALGNAGLEPSVPHMEEVIKDRKEHPIVRAMAIDGLRRLRMRMPKTIQNMLMPLFEDTNEMPELRMGAFSVIMQTIPEAAIVDQMIYKLAKDDREQLKAFVYTSLKAFAATAVPAERKLAQHVRSILRSVNFDNEMLRWSRRYTLPIYNQQQEEGLFLNLASILSNRTALPVHIAASLDALLNNEFEKNLIKMSLTQTDMEWMLENVTEPIFGRFQGQREQRMHESSKKSLMDMFRGLFTKARRDDQDKPFGMAVLRIADFDRVILPFAERNLPEELQKLIRGEKPELQQLAAYNGHFRMSVMTSLGEKSAKIPTSAGLPIRYHQTAPILASIDASLKAASDDELNVKATVKPQIIVSTIRKVQIWTPAAISGVSTTRSIGFRVPLALKIAKVNGEIVAKIETPSKNVRLMGFQTLPSTFTLELDQKTNMPIGTRGTKSVQNRQVEHRMQDVDITFGTHARLPVSIYGRYHVPRHFTMQDAIDMFSTTENHVHIEFQPSAESPKYLALGANLKIFEEARDAQPKFEKFFRGAAKFEHVYPEEYADFDMEADVGRDSKVQQFIERYQPKKAYKHSFEVTAKTVGGQRDMTGQMNIELTCEATPGYCKASMEAAGSNTNNKWTMEADGEMILPLGAAEMERLEELPSKQNRFVAQMQAKWGVDKTNRQSVNVRVLGMPALSRQMRAMEQEYSKDRKEEAKITRFINHYDLVAEYDLQKEALNTANTAMEALKAYTYWNTWSEFVRNDERQLKANVLIDPITRQYTNVSIQTPTQKMRINSYLLLFKMGPLPLIRQPTAPKHSGWDIVKSMASVSGAQCKIDETVKTFDGVTIDTPLPPCYVVVAKDCAREEPRYAVLMKQTSTGSKSKSLKVISQKGTIEVETERDGQLKVKKNNRRISDDDDEMIHFVSEEEVLVTIPGMEVRFDGKKAIIRSSLTNKNGVCGLCGHYDGERRDELRMPNNEMASDVREFHRSYVISKDDCDKDQLEEFYGRDHFHMGSSYESFEDSDRSERREQRIDGDENEPKPMTKVLEYNNKVCFSKQPVAGCRRGETATGHTEKKSVAFACLNRSTLEVNSLMREQRRRGVVDVSEYPTSLTNEIYIPTRCIRY